MYLCSVTGDNNSSFFVSDHLECQDSVASRRVQTQPRVSLVWTCCSPRYSEQSTSPFAIDKQLQGTRWPFRVLVYGVCEAFRLVLSCLNACHVMHMQTFASLQYRGLPDERPNRTETSQEMGCWEIVRATAIVNTLKRIQIVSQFPTSGIGCSGIGLTMPTCWTVIIETEELHTINEVG